MTFEITRQMSVSRDKEGHIRQLSHPKHPFYGAETRARAFDLDTAGQPTVSPRELADTYVREMLPNLGLDQGVADNLGALATASEPERAERPQLHFAEEKVSDRQATVSYVQTALGLPVWRSGFAVRMRGEPLGVIGSESSIDPELRQVDAPKADAQFLPEAIDVAALQGLLALQAAPEITGKRLIVYRYDPDNRGNAVAAHDPDAEAAAEACPMLSPPAVPSTIEPGRYYVVGEILFSYTAEGWGPLNWRVFVEPETGAALRIEALVSCVDGMVLERDPLTASGVNILPTAAAADLDALRARVGLPGIASVAGQRHELSGPFVRIANMSAPHVSPPTVQNGSVFDFSFPTDDFAAVNAYYHCDRCFRLLEELGFDVAAYFDGTQFPVKVDHRATIAGQVNTVNAQAPGNTAGVGSDGFRFALLAPNATIGMAVEQRVTWHEFGHALLWDHLHSPNFPFAHSIGDTIAAILLDPDCQAPDLGRTFPWTIITRRHDHEPASGFAWGGSQDDTLPVGNIFSHDRAGYKREQILSSTLFRFYRSIGGGHDDLAVRLAASQRAVWLLLEAISSLSPVAPPATSEDFLRILVEADLFGQPPVEPTARGIFHKVLRWCFERQGLFQPAGAATPVASPGAAPEVDVFVDDGRTGGYDPVTSDLVEAPGLWCRKVAGGPATHEEPTEGEPALIYVAATNRGSVVASGVEARVAMKGGAAGDAWPDGWVDLPAAAGARLIADVAPGQTETFGPFAWTPAQAGQALLFADVHCNEDESIVRSTLVGSPSAVLIAMFDNNAAVRLVSVVSAVA
jgi:zinc metalloprotease ZmpB